MLANEKLICGESGIINFSSPVFARHCNESFKEYTQATEVHKEHTQARKVQHTQASNECS